MDAHVHEAFAKFAVFTAILHALVETVYRQQVVSPTAGIHAVPSGSCRRDGVHETGKETIADQFRHLPREGLPLTAKPTDAESPPAADVVTADELADRHHQFEITTGEHVARPCQTLVGCEEIGAWNAVLIGEYEIVGSSLFKCAVQDGGFSETPVFVPHMAYGQTLGIAADELARLLARPVVGNDDFIGLA